MALETLTSHLQTSIPEGTWVEVHLGKILRNLERLREKTGPDTHVMAVVKSDAYGHGMIAVSKALEGKVDFLGVGSLKEAGILREQGVNAPLFVFGRLFSDELPLALQWNLVLTVSSFEEAEALSEISTRFSKISWVHIKVDTGMHRLGIPCRRAFSEITKIAALPNIQLDGIYTHFPTAELYPDEFTQKELSDFEKLIQDLKQERITFRFRHAANSAGAIRIRSPWLNLIRPGIALYGIYPGSGFEKEMRLEPALALKSRIVFLKRIAAGESVGYGRTFTAGYPTTMALVPIGYAHGYPFHLSGKGMALYQGKRCRIAGRVCMDSLMIELGPRTQAKIGDEVTLLGSQGEEAITATELAQLAQTIPYEIVTRLDSRLPRLYPN